LGSVLRTPDQSSTVWKPGRQHAPPRPTMNLEQPLSLRTQTLICMANQCQDQGQDQLQDHSLVRQQDLQLPDQLILEINTFIQLRAVIVATHNQPFYCSMAELIRNRGTEDIMDINMRRAVHHYYSLRGMRKRRYIPSESCSQ
jgi:DNA topoisomerase VI subunit B